MKKQSTHKRKYYSKTKAGRKAIKSSKIRIKKAPKHNYKRPF